MRSYLFSIFFLSLCSPQIFAAENTPLFFQADKNNLQILPQRFEYNLDDEDHIKIGDIVIDSNTFSFQINSAPDAQGNHHARFIWPAGLLKEGVLCIRDNTGKAIWSAKVNRKNTRTIVPAQNAQNSMVRANLSEYVSTAIKPSLIEDMKYFPFMNFCINRQSKDTNIYLCSKEVFFANQQGKLTLRSRSQGKRTAFVEINGRSVSNQGVIYLNDAKENIGFRAMTQSGAILEVETRMKSVDFKDVVVSADGKSLILTASGAEPVNEEKVKKLANNEWQFEVDIQRPVLYLKGEGDIPMRQEFYPRGALPQEELRPYLQKDSVTEIFSSRITLKGEAAKNTSVSAGEKNQALVKEGSHFEWTLEDLPRGETSRRYLRVQSQQNNFLAAYDIYRGYAFEAGVLASFWSPASQAYGSLHGKWWIENLFGIQQDWSRFHWGILAAHSLLLLKKDGEMNLNMTHLELLWRALPGFHLADSTWGLALPFEMLQGNGLSLASPGVGLFYENKAPGAFQSLLHWYDLKLNYLLGSSGNVKLKNAIQLNALAYYHVDKRMSWNYGLGLQQYSFDPGDSKMQVQLSGGINYRF